ncbi:hypothetical protein ABPG74_004400 [Tetrahymena malaccensis]
MRQSGYQQQFQIQQQRSTQFFPSSSQRVQTLPSDLNNQLVNTPSSFNRKSLYQSPSSTQIQPRMAASPLNQRFSSPMPTKIAQGYASPLSNSNVSLVNGQLTASVNQQNGYVNTILNSPSTPQASNQFTASQSSQNQQFSKTLSGGFSANSLTSSQNMGIAHNLNSTGNESVFQQASLIKDLDLQVKKLKDELETSRAIQVNTQKHNDELIKKIRVLINENEKMQLKEQEKEEQNIKDQKIPPNIQVLLLENKKFQGIIRDLESKAKLLILENEKQTFLLKQNSILQQKSKAQGENVPTDSVLNVQLNNLTLQDYKERCAQLEKKLEIQMMEQKNIQNLASTWEQKLDLLLQENEKLQKLVKEKIQQHENLSRENTSLLQRIKELKNENEKLQQVMSESGLSDMQVMEMETKFQTILEENNRINELLTERNTEADKQQYKIIQLQEQLNQLSQRNPIQSIDIIEEKPSNQETELRKQLLEMSEKLKELQESNDKLNVEKQILQEENQQISQLINQNQAYQQEIQLKQEIISQLNENQKYKSESQHLQNHFYNSQEIDLIKEEYSQSILRFEQYVQEVEIEKQELILVQNEKIEEFQKNLNELIIKLENSETKVKQLQEQLVEKHNLLQQKTQEINTMKIKVSVSAEQMERCKIEIDDFNKQLLEKQIEVTQKQSQIDQFENQVNYLTKEKDNLKNEVSKLNTLLQARKDQFDIANKNLQETRNELSKSLTNNYQLQQENTNLSLNNQKLVENINKLEEQLKIIDNQHLSQLKNSDCSLFQQKQSIVIETSSKQNQIILRLLELEKNLQQKIFANTNGNGEYMQKGQSLSQQIIKEEKQESQNSI